MNSQAKNEDSAIWWRWTDRGRVSYSVCVLNTSQRSSSFVISSLSHISIELSGTDMRDLPRANICSHMYTYV